VGNTGNTSCEQQPTPARRIPTLFTLASEPLAHTRRQIRGSALDRIRQERGTDDLVRRMWDSPAARETVAQYVRKTLRN
jgi:hypothetical protein